MSILCAIGGHEAADGEVWNDGYYFGSCKRCACDMIRSRDDWQTVPQGHRVVWKGGYRHSHSIAPDYGRNLPVVYGSAKPANGRSLFASRNRRMIELATPGHSAGNGRSRYRAADDHQYPYLIALAAMAGAGIELLLRSRARRTGYG